MRTGAGGRLRQHWKPVLVVGVVVLGGLAYVGQERWRDRCGADAETLSADDVGTVLRPPGEISGADPDLLAALEDLPAPFGPLVGGAVYDGPMSAPSVGVLDDATAYLAAGGGLIGSEYDGQVVAVDVASGEGRWGIGVRGYGAGGGRVGDSFVTLGIPEDEAPQLAAYDLDSGDREHCTKLGDDTETGFDPTLGSATVGDSDVVVVQVDLEDQRRLFATRLDPATGDESWSGPVDRPSWSVEVDDAGRVVLLSSVGRRDPAVPSSVFLGDLRGITALSAEDGSVSWTWPETVPEDSAVQVKVVGTDPDRALTYAIEAVVPVGVRGDPSTRLVALDATGRVAWARALPKDYCEAALWGEQVMTSCGGTPLLTSYDAVTGELRWKSPTPGRTVRFMIRVTANPAVDLGDGTWLQRADDGVLRVDATTGEISEVVAEDRLDTYASDIEVVGDHLVLATESGVFAFERSAGPAG